MNMSTQSPHDVDVEVDDADVDVDMDVFRRPEDTTWVQHYLGDRLGRTFDPACHLGSVEPR